jgi:SAM-dependent methyltransferase
MATSDWDVHYQSGMPPWETGRPSEELQRVLAERKIAPCRMIELGCGSGINAVWLAQQGFDVTGVDVSSLAIAKAKERARIANVNVRFRLADVLDLPDDIGTFAFFFDRGCYHAVRRDDVQAYLRTLEQVTAPGGMGLVLTGNAKSTHEPTMGPPVVSEPEIRSELGSVLEIVQLREFFFDQIEGGVRFLAWSCLLRRE